MINVRSISFRWYLLIAVVILMGAFFVRIIGLSQTSFSIDEVYTMQTMEETLYGRGFVQGMRNRFVHMPVYFASLFVIPPPPQDFNIRYPSVLWSMITIAVTMRILSHIYRSPKFALFAGLLLAVHLFDIVNSRTARMYPISNALIAMSTYLFLRYMSNPQHHLSRWYGAHAIAMFAYLTHVANFMLFLGQGLVWFRRFLERKVKLGRTLFWLLVQLSVMIPAFIWATFVFNNEGTALDWIGTPSLMSGLLVLENLILGAEVQSTVMLLLPVYLLPFIVYGVFFKRIKYAEYWLGLTLIPFISLFGVSFFKSLFVHRYLGVSLFAYVIVIALAYKELMNFALSHRRRIGVILVGSLILVHMATSTLFMVRMFRIDFFSGNFVKQAAAFIAENGNEGDAIWYQIGAFHIEHYLPDGKFNVLQDQYTDRDIFLETGRFPQDRIWVLDTNNIWAGTRIEAYEPLFEQWGTRVFLIEKEDN